MGLAAALAEVEMGSSQMRGKGKFYIVYLEEQPTYLCTIGIVTTKLPRRCNNMNSVEKIFWFGYCC